MDVFCVLRSAFFSVQLRSSVHFPQLITLHHLFFIWHCYSLKKEEFYLNRKRVQKSEVMSLLESAGFSKSNPYYIVQQGKVANLCVMKDKDRLNLLKEVAGTTVYEERRAESVKIMLDTANKKEKVEVRAPSLPVCQSKQSYLAVAMHFKEVTTALLFGRTVPFFASLLCIVCFLYSIHRKYC